GVLMHITHMRKVHQIVVQQLIVRVDGGALPLIGPGRISMPWVLDDFGCVGQRRVSHPYPYQIVLLYNGITSYDRLGRNLLLAWNPHTAPASIKRKSMIAALKKLTGNDPVLQRQAAMTATVFQRRHCAALHAVQHDRLLEYGSSHRL